MSRTGAEVYCGHYGIVQNGLLLVGKFYGVVYFGCTVCHGDSFRALRERYYRLDTKNLTSSLRAPARALDTHLYKLCIGMPYSDTASLYWISLASRRLTMLSHSSVGYPHLSLLVWFNSWKDILTLRGVYLCPNS